MSKHLDELYFIWLCALVGVEQNSNKVRLLKRMFQTRFEWFIPFDDNRAADGIALRTDFVFDHNPVDAEYEWMDTPCSMLEMLVALSKRMSLQTDIEPRRCFWHMMRNAGLDADRSDIFIDEALSTINDRTYAPNGEGGLFPLEDPAKDQTQVELLYQMYAYVLESDF